MKFIVFYLEFINSLEGPGMFFSSAAIIRRLRSYAATVIKSVLELIVAVFIDLIVIAKTSEKFDSNYKNNFFLRYFYGFQKSTSKGWSQNSSQNIG